MVVWSLATLSHYHASLELWEITSNSVKTHLPAPQFEGRNKDWRQHFHSNMDKMYSLSRIGGFI